MLKHLMFVVVLGTSPVFTSLPGHAQEVETPAEVVVNINHADAQKLAQVLDGIGHSRAEEIVRYREAYGPFFAVEDLMEVRGIGEAILNNNRERIVLE